jgi:hypothetical protein
MMFSLVGCVEGVESDTSDTVTITNNDMYEFVDPQTGVHYWVYSHSEYYKGMGGMTPRLNADGTIMVTPVTE